MLSFDPDRFAVLAEPRMTRVELPGKKYSAYGLVRDVWLHEDDLPYRMVSFSCADLCPLLGLEKGSYVNKYLTRWRWPVPKYRAQTARMHQAAKGMTWEAVNVFTYPEAEALIDHYKRAKRINPQGLTHTKAPTAARAITLKIEALREELEATYE